MESFWKKFKFFRAKIYVNGFTISELKLLLNEKYKEFIIEPYIRFQGKKGEQKTMFFKDPSGNALEFKTFKNIDQLFEK